jgi:uncharacterized protein (TIGR02646 family)
MIRLERGPKPAVLAEKGDEWAEEFLGFEGRLATMAASMRYRYRATEIKEAVRRDAHGKCIYCESYITQVHPGEIDHIRPVSKRRDLVVEWGNLAYVCTECNREKRDYYEPALPLVNPFEDDPNEHLAFYGPAVLHRTGSERGEVTVKRLRLNLRRGLFERRKDRIEELQTLLDRLKAIASEPLRQVVAGVLEEELADGKPYAAVAREFVRQARASAVP